MIEPRTPEGTEMYRRQDRTESNRPTCRKCLIRPEGIARTGLCHSCRSELDRIRADKELNDAKPMEWK